MTRSKISKRILDSTSDEVRASVQKIAGEMISVSDFRDLIQRAFVAGRSQTTWEQFKKDNGLRDKHPGASDEEINQMLKKL